MGLSRIFLLLMFGLMSLYLFSGCGDLEPEMQDTRTVVLKMNFNQRSSSRNSSVSQAEVSSHKTHLILALPYWENLSSNYKNYYSSFAQELMNPTDNKVSLEIPLNTQMKIFAFLFSDDYTKPQLLSVVREVGYYGESQPFSIGTNTNNLSLGITLQSAGTTDDTDPGTDPGTGTDTTPVAPVIIGISSGTFTTSQNFTVNGESGATIEYSLDGGTTWLAYSAAVTLTNEGSYTITARQRSDAAGNWSVNATYITVVINQVTDTDGDGVGNNLDTDDDNDGISDADELAYGSDPLDNSSLPTNDRWSGSIKGGNIVLSNYNLDASSQNTNFSWNSVYGEKSYSVDAGGIFEWKIQVISVDDDNDDSWEMVIGVGVFTEGEANSYNENNFLSYQTKGFGYIQQDGKKTSGSGSGSFLSNYNLNDNITVRLDLNYDRLSFYKNNGDIRLSHFSLPSDSGKKYRLAASIGDDGDKFRIISHTTNSCVPPPSWLSGSVQSETCSGHDACGSKQWEGNWEITCGGGGERKCRNTNLTCGTGNCSVSVSGGGHDAYQNSVVFAENITSGNAFTLSCNASGQRGCKNIDIWCPTAAGASCSCTGTCNEVNMHCPQTGGSCTKSGSEQTKDNITATVFCQ